MPSGSDFSAAPSALGAISIEKLDDVAFEEDGEPKQLLQFKHHVINSATLTDSSTDLWKTLRVWEYRGERRLARSDIGHPVAGHHLVRSRRLGWQHAAGR